MPIESPSSPVHQNRYFGYSPFGAVSRGVNALTNMIDPNGENETLGTISRVAGHVGDVVDGLSTIGVF